MIKSTRSLHYIRPPWCREFAKKSVTQTPRLLWIMLHPWSFGTSCPWHMDLFLQCMLLTNLIRPIYLFFCTLSAEFIAFSIGSTLWLNKYALWIRNIRLQSVYTLTTKFYSIFFQGNFIYPRKDSYCILQAPVKDMKNLKYLTYALFASLKILQIDLKRLWFKLHSTTSSYLGTWTPRSIMSSSLWDRQQCFIISCQLTIYCLESHFFTPPYSNLLDHGPLADKYTSWVSRDCALSCSLREWHECVWATIRVLPCVSLSVGNEIRRDSFRTRSVFLLRCATAASQKLRIWQIYA